MDKESVNGIISSYNNFCHLGVPAGIYVSIYYLLSSMYCSSHLPIIFVIYHLSSTIFYYHYVFHLFSVTYFFTIFLSVSYLCINIQFHSSPYILHLFTYLLFTSSFPYTLKYLQNISLCFYIPTFISLNDILKTQLLKR